MKHLKFQAAVLLLQVSAIVLFTCGFLLTRVELNDRSSCDDFHQDGYYSVCTQPPFSKVVIVIVDALRFDFFHSDLAEPLPHHSQLQRVKQLLANTGPAAVSAKFVADPPTTTMQRLKAMLTGVLPTFVDVGNSFSASAVTEDNLAHQLYTQKRKMVFVGDDTWTQLVPEVFTTAYPYPSFNVRDLHTVDNGVWEHVVPLLQSPEEWDVLVAHYLGVDHAGHTHGVNSQQMRDKVQQMDEQLKNITDYLVGAAGEGGAHEETLLIILSDHGQTMGGDHGGGSDEEVDSFFAAINLCKARRWLQQQNKQGAATAGDTGAGTSVKQQKSEKCWNTVVPQLDFTATLAALLGAPIPFGNVGKVSPHVWRVALQDGQLPSDCQAQAFSGWLASDLERYVQILMTNAAQVQRYLQAYSKQASLPSVALSHCTHLYEKAAEFYAANATKDPEAAAEKLLEYLAAAANMARRQFTQFNLWLMGGGCTLLAATVVMQLIKTWQSFGGLGPWCWSLDVLGACVCIAFHAGAIFSTNLVMSEGRVQCALVVTLSCLLFLRACLDASWKLRMKRRIPTLALPSTTAATKSDHVPSHQAHSHAGNGIDQLNTSFSPPCTRRSTSCSYGAITPAAVLIAASVALWMYGLIDRTGQDPHDKSEMDTEAMHGAQMGWQQQALRVQLPLLLFPVLFHIAMNKLGHHSNNMIVRHAPMMVWSEYATIALWWTAQLHPDWWQASLQDLILSGIQQLSELPVYQVPLVHETLQYVSSWLSRPHASDAAGVWLPVQWIEHHAVEQLQLPMRLLLPRLVYTMCLKWLVGGALIWIVELCIKGRIRHEPEEGVSEANDVKTGTRHAWIGWGSAGKKEKQKEDEQAVAASRHKSAAAAIIASAAVISGPVVVLLGVKGPLVMLLAAIQSACVIAYVTSIMAVHSAEGVEEHHQVPPVRVKATTSIMGSTAPPGEGTTHSQLSSKGPVSEGKAVVRSGPVDGAPSQPQSSVSSDDELRNSFLVATLSAMFGVQLFFCSGHFCEFSGLQYPSSFVGFDDMHWYRSGLLLLLNTFGLHWLAYLLLPAVAAFMLPQTSTPYAVVSSPEEQTQKLVCPPSKSVIHDSYKPSSCSRTEDTDQSEEEEVSGPSGCASTTSDRHGKLQAPLRLNNVSSQIEPVRSWQDKGWVQYCLCLERVMMVAGLVRGLNVLAAVISAGYQRRHLLVWALFAPKFVFEIWFLVMSHVASLVALSVTAAYAQ